MIGYRIDMDSSVMQDLEGVALEGGMCPRKLATVLPLVQSRQPCCLFHAVRVLVDVCCERGNLWEDDYYYTLSVVNFMKLGLTPDAALAVIDWVYSHDDDIVDHYSVIHWFDKYLMPERAFGEACLLTKPCKYRY